MSAILCNSLYQQKALFMIESAMGLCCVGPCLINYKVGCGGQPLALLGLLTLSAYSRKLTSSTGMVSYFRTGLLPSMVL